MCRSPRKAIRILVVHCRVPFHQVSTTPTRERERDCGQRQTTDSHGYPSEAPTAYTARSIALITTVSLTISAWQSRLKQVSKTLIACATSSGTWHLPLTPSGTLPTRMCLPDLPGYVRECRTSKSSSY